MTRKFSCGQIQRAQALVRDWSDPMRTHTTQSRELAVLALILAKQRAVRMKANPDRLAIEIYNHSNPDQPPSYGLIWLQRVTYHPDPRPHRFKRYQRLLVDWSTLELVE